MPDGSAGIHTVFASQDLPQDALAKLQRRGKKLCNLNLSFYNYISLVVHRSLIQIGENSVMILNSIEREFLSRLSFEPWTSPPVFDHQLVDPLVANNYVTAEPQGGGRYYEITELGRAAIVPVDATKAGGSGRARVVGNS